MMVTAGENMGKRLSKEIQTLGIDIQMLCVFTTRNKESDGSCVVCLQVTCLYAVFYLFNEGCILGIKLILQVGKDKHLFLLVNICFEFLL